MEEDLETIESAVAAFYSGDSGRAAELFELTDRTDDEIRAESAYQGAIGGRLTLTCNGSGGGMFSCRVPYHNTITDAIAHVDQGDTIGVTVENGVVTQFAFPEHSWIVLQMGSFLALSDRFDGYEECGFGPFSESCAVIQLENLDAWVDWRKTPPDPASVVEVTLESWYGGGCEVAVFLSVSVHFDDDTDCESGASGPSPAATIEYEHLLGAEVTVEKCERLETGANDLSCEVHYANAMNRAVDKPPAVMTREFTVPDSAFVTALGGESTWYRDNYPEDSELSASFKRFAEEGDLKKEEVRELRAAYDEAGCATARTHQCANLILDNINDWAAWHLKNA
ncbi:MAG: hypothetical protein HKO03_00095 [Acidimicrobiia bacterium]|nr:hypothetical protein [Acidimicrobiia bacterium]